MPTFLEGYCYCYCPLAFVSTFSYFCSTIVYSHCYYLLFFIGYYFFSYAYCNYLSNYNHYYEFYSSLIFYLHKFYYTQHYHQHPDCRFPKLPHRILLVSCRFYKKSLKYFYKKDRHKCKSNVFLHKAVCVWFLDKLKCHV